MTDETTLAQLRGLRADNKMVREAILVFGKTIAGFDVRLGNIEKLLTDARSDIIMLENKNLERHSEVLDILCRLDTDG